MKRKQELYFFYERVIKLKTWLLPSCFFFQYFTNIFFALYVKKGIITNLTTCVMQYISNENSLGIFFKQRCFKVKQLLYNVIHMESTNIRILRRRQRNNNSWKCEIKEYSSNLTHLLYNVILRKGLKQHLYLEQQHW